MSHAFSKILIIIIILLIIVIGADFYIFRPEILIREGDRSCVVDEDCAVFGKTGDCICGCYNKNELPIGISGKCYCKAPKSCKCVGGECKKIYSWVDEIPYWKTYRNEEYGFETKYPQNREVQIKDSSYWCQEEKGYSCLEYVQVLPEGTNIVVYGNPENFSIKEWLNKYMPWVFTKQCNSEEIKIDGNNGIKAMCTNGARVIDNFVSKGNYLFMIGISLGLNSETAEEALNQTLSTFRFLE